MSNKIYIFFIVYILLTGHFAIGQQDEGFIYGKLTTKTGNQYIGQIRWDDEEVFWHDIFNSIKTYGNSGRIRIEIRDEDSEQKIKEIHKWELLEIWDDKYSGQIHQFTCRFGDIKSIKPQGTEEVDIVFKNGYKINVNGGSNDVQATVHVLDYELGQIKIAWNNISQIDFFDTPYSIKQKFGKPLYGTVKTSSGYCTGLIQWDNDERLDIDILDGYHEGNENHIPFSNIKCIKKKGCESEVTKITGNILVLSETNDVNCDNRGVNVIVDHVGTLSVPWKSFQQICFDHSNIKTGEPYRSYPEPKRLSGVVKTLDHRKLMGYIVFDKDESWDFEMLEGKMDNIKYIIPFRNIQSISPRNTSSANVQLRNGQKLILGELQDVSTSNEGILIYAEEGKEPVFIDWSNVDEIFFE